MNKKTVKEAGYLTLAIGCLTGAGGSIRSAFGIHRAAQNKIGFVGETSKTIEDVLQGPISDSNLEILERNLYALKEYIGSFTHRIDKLWYERISQAPTDIGNILRIDTWEKYEALKDHIPGSHGCIMERLYQTEGYNYYAGACAEHMERLRETINSMSKELIMFAKGASISFEVGLAIIVMALLAGAGYSFKMLYDSRTSVEK